MMTHAGLLWRSTFCGQLPAVAYPGILFGGGGSTNSVEDRGQRESGVLEAAVIWYMKFHFI